jgi:3-oxoacyl-[acyl-carrier protein] reductase
LDVLINNAGINQLATLEELDDATLNSMLQVNLTGQIQLMRGVLPLLKASHSGRVVNISSIWSQFSKVRRLAYSVAKAGIQGLTQSAAVELGSQGILVNAVAPGFVRTEMTEQNNTSEQLAVIAQALPLGRLASPTEIAEVVYFLASEQNTFITGQTIFADGGFSCV